MTDESTTVAVALARIEGKLDRLGDSINALSTDSLDHEMRIRALEARPTVSPKQLAAWLTTSLAFVATATPIVLIFTR